MQTGIHERIELHEVISDAINKIDHYAMYIAQAEDPELRSVLECQQQYMLQDYHKMVGALQGRGVNVMPYHPRMGCPEYGTEARQPVVPQPRAKHLSDRAIASGALNLHKCGATKSTKAALETADPELRLLLTNGTLTCVNMAYEVFLYMNRRGYYQVPTADRQTSQQALGSYQAPTVGQSPFGTPHPGHLQQPKGVNLERFNSTVDHSAGPVYDL